MRFHSLVVAVIAFSISHPTTTRADDTGNGASTYVSEQFKTVAKKLVTQYIGGELRKACPDDRPLCSELVDGLVDAFSAITSANSTDGLRAALRSFFIQSSIAGAASLLLNPLIEERSGMNADAIKKLDSVAGPLSKCFVDLLRDRPTDDCQLDEATLKAIKSLGFQGNDATNLDALIKKIRNHQRPTFDDVGNVLEGIAAIVHRDDLRVPIDVMMKSYDNKGLENGLFGLAQEFLEGRVFELDEIQNDQGPRLADAAANDAFDNALALCKEPDLRTAYHKWIALKATFQTVDRYVALRVPVPSEIVSAVDAMASATCTTDNVSASSTAATVSRQSRYLRGALLMNRFRSSEPSILALAAIVDLVRNSDSTRFKDEIVASAMSGIDQLQWRACMNIHPDKCKGLVSAQPKEETCQGAMLKGLLRGETVDTTKKCFDLNDGSDCDKLTDGDPLKDHCAISATPYADSIAVLKKQAISANLDDDDKKTIEQLIHAVQAFAGHDEGAAYKTLERLAVELLLNHAREIAEHQLNKGGVECEADTRSTSIFSGLGARCAMLLLIQSAYYPIADYLWDGGLDADNVSKVAESAYRSMLGSKLLAGSPIILNVGLGATAVWGKSDVWGPSAYTALTVVDKFGLVFARRRWDRFTFEEGVFAGGFVDALVRTMAGTDRKFWLLGYTVGFTRLFGYDFGVQFHAAAAMPFEFEGKDVGFAAGAVLVIPWDDYLEEK